MPPPFHVFVTDPIPDSMLVSGLGLGVVAWLPPGEVHGRTSLVSAVFQSFDFLKGKGGEGDAFDPVREFAVDARACCIMRKGKQGR
jgi:hypothetical protein